MYLEYAQGLGANQEVINWIGTTLNAYLKRRAPSQVEVEHVLDFLLSSQAPTKLVRMSYEQAKTKADVWTKTQQKKGSSIKEEKEDIEIVHKFKDGSTIVKLIGKSAFQREGFLMSHCVSDWFNKKDRLVYSYRDIKNNPHATFEVEKNGKDILQVKGKGNGSIHPKYIHPILEFFKHIGFEVRASEMKNLGYHHFDEEYERLVAEFVGPVTKTKIGNKEYVFVG